MYALGVCERLPQDDVVGQFTALCGQIEPREILHHDRPGSQVEVSYLGVAHLSLRQADGGPAGGQ